jgi:hypothetical protein
MDREMWSSGRRRAWRDRATGLGAVILFIVSCIVMAGASAAASAASPPNTNGTELEFSIVTKGPHLGDYEKSAQVWFEIPGGNRTVTIKPAGGGSDLSNCTRDESSDSFKVAPPAPIGQPTPRENIRTIKMVAKDTGRCAFEASYETWNIEVSANPHTPNLGPGSGHVWLGQTYASGDYFVSCTNGAGKPWTKLLCFAMSRDRINVRYPLG